MFNPVNLTTWKRKKYFDYYFHDVPCTYSMTLDLDLTNLLATVKKNNIRLTPSFIYLITSAVNNFPEFRTTFDKYDRLFVTKELPLTHEN